jgi:hypothetical protein
MTGDFRKKEKFNGLTLKNKHTNNYKNFCEVSFTTENDFEAHFNVVLLRKDLQNSQGYLKGYCTTEEGDKVNFDNIEAFVSYDSSLM